MVISITYDNWKTERTRLGTDAVTYYMEDSKSYTGYLVNALLSGNIVLISSVYKGTPSGDDFNSNIIPTALKIGGIQS